MKDFKIVGHEYAEIEGLDENEKILGYLEDFYDDYDINERVILCIIKWVRRKYSSTKHLYNLESFKKKSY